MTHEQFTRLIESFGAQFYGADTIVAKFDKPVTDDNGETITHPDAIYAEAVMMKLGYGGALIGHPLDESDTTYIHFRTSEIIQS